MPKPAWPTSEKEQLELERKSPAERATAAASKVTEAIGQQCARKEAADLERKAKLAAARDEAEAAAYDDHLQAGILLQQLRRGLGDVGVAATQHTMASATLAAAARRVQETVSGDVRAAAALRRARAARPLSLIHI